MRRVIRGTLGIGILGLFLYTGESIMDWYERFSFTHNRAALKKSNDSNEDKATSPSRGIASVSNSLTQRSEVMAIAKSLETDRRIPRGDKNSSDSSGDLLWVAHVEEKGLKEFDKDLGKYMKDSHEEKMIKQLLVLNHEGVTHTPDEYRMIGQAHEELLKNPSASANFIKDAFEGMPSDSFAKERSYLMQLAMQLTEDQNAKGVIEQMLMKEMQKDYGPYNPENISSSMPVIAISSYFAMTMEPEKRQAAGQIFLSNQKDPQLIQMYQSMMQQSPPPAANDNQQTSSEGVEYNRTLSEFHS